MSKLPCYYAHGGMNYKNQFVTTCPISGGRLQTVDGTLPSDFWNNEKFREYRQMLDRGEWPDGCILCKTAEAEGTKSMRHDYPADLTNYDPITGEVKLEGLKHVELRFSNACNMACLHCSEVYSSNWGSRLKNYIPDQIDIEYNLEQLLQTQHRIGPDDNTQIRLSKADALDIVEDLNKNFPNIEKIDFAGGEVLYQKQFFPVLEKLAEHPNAKNIFIFFHTNFNAKFDVDRLNELLKPFGKTRIKISVDSGTNIYSYFRDGDWNVLKANLEKFKKVNDTTHLAAVCTTSIYQIFDIKNIMLSLCDLDLDSISLSTVFTPRYINPAVAFRLFPQAVINDLNETRIALHDLAKQRRTPKNWRRYRSYVVKFDRFADIDGALKDLDEIQNYITNHETTAKDAKAFVHYANKMDKLWKQNFNDYFVKYKLSEDKVMRILQADYNHEYPYKGIKLDKRLKEIQLASNLKINELRKTYDKLLSFPSPDVLEEDYIPRVEEDDVKKHLQDMSEEISLTIKDIRPVMDKEYKQKIDRELEDLDRIAKRPHYNAFVRYKSYVCQSHHVIDFINEEFNHLIKMREHESKIALYKAGFQQFKQDGVNIPFNPDWKKIAVNLSGGADSACLTSVLCKYIEENNINCTIDVITHRRVWTIRPWAGPISKIVYDKLKEKWPNIIGERITNYVPPELEHSALGDLVDGRSGDQIIVDSFNNYVASENGYSAIFNATTKNPSMDDPTADRMKNRDLDSVTIGDFVQERTYFWTCTPLIATEKDWVYKQYKELDLMDLYALTRSCEGDGSYGGPLAGKDYWWYKHSDEEIPTCGKCFWCKEREWAEQQYEL